MATIAATDQNGIRHAEDISVARRCGAFAFLAMAYFLYAWSWNSVDTLRPYIAESLGLSIPQAGSLYSVQALGAVAGAMINSQLADRFGRRRALMAVMIGFGLSLFMGAFVTSYWQVLLQRTALGYFTGSMYPVAVGIYSALFSKHVRSRIASIIIGSAWLASATLGFVAAAVFRAGIDWKVLLWVGLIPVALALTAPLFVPDDRKIIPYGESSLALVAKGHLPIAELFAPNVRRQTILLATLVGFNHFAYQAFSGWASTYLKADRAFSDSDTTMIVGWMSAGSFIGGFFWGWIGDRYGRRMGAFGFILTSVLILVFLYIPLAPTGQSVVAVLYGMMLGCSVVWGPWLAELYPSHLRSTAASIFHWGRLLSFMAPLATGFMSERVGLAASMTTGSILFFVAALIWFALPETLSFGDEKSEKQAA